MNIGKPVREIIVEPVQLPEPVRPEAEPEHAPAVEPEWQPQEEPSHV